MEERQALERNVEKDTDVRQKKPNSREHTEEVVNIVWRTNFVIRNHNFWCIISYWKLYKIIDDGAEANYWWLNKNCWMTSEEMVHSVFDCKLPNVCFGYSRNLGDNFAVENPRWILWRDTSARKTVTGGNFQWTIRYWYNWHFCSLRKLHEQYNNWWEIIEQYLRRERWTREWEVDHGRNYTKK